jgi:transposase InsO family protein
MYDGTESEAIDKDETRSALHRCLKRHGISRLPAIEGEKPAKKRFKTYPIGFFHIDIAELRTEEGKLYLFIAIDRTAKFAFARLLAKANTATAVAFLDELIEAIPYKINVVLSDNGIQFADLPKNRSGPTATWRRHLFDRACQRYGIEHRLTKPNHPWTNGQVERMNRTLKEATVQRYYYDSHEQLRAHLTDFLAAYNFARQTLRGLTPHEYVCKIWTEDPHRFRLDPIHHTTGLYS